MDGWMDGWIDELCQLYCLQDNVVQEEISVDPKYHRYFVQRRGQVCNIVYSSVHSPNPFIHTSIHSTVSLLHNTTK